MVLQSGTASPAIVIDTANNVGIGITNPNYLLHLHKTTTAQDVRIAITDGTTTGAVNRGLHLIKGSDSIGYLLNYENKDLIFATNAVERMRISANGSSISIGNGSLF